MKRVRRERGKRVVGKRGNEGEEGKEGRRREGGKRGREKEGRGECWGVGVSRRKGKEEGIEALGGEV